MKFFLKFQIIFNYLKWETLGISASELMEYIESECI